MKKNQGREVKSNKFKLRTVLKRTNLGKTGAFSGTGKERRYETGICRNAKYRRSVRIITQRR